ncbi:MAG: NfeD family protein [Verrucomicrobiota bacterium]
MLETKLTKSLLRRSIYLAMVGVGLFTLAAKKQPAETRSPQGEERAANGLRDRVLVIRIEDVDISDDRRFRSLRRLISDAAAAPAKAVVFDLNTGSGYSEQVARFLMEELPKVKVPSVSYANPSALGAGALIALGSDTVYLSPVAVMGGAAPSPSGGRSSASTGDDQSEKSSAARPVSTQSLSILKAQARGLAKQKGHRSQVAEAFIDSQIEVKIGDEMISAKGELLTLTADEAVRKLPDGQTLFGKSVVGSIKELLKQEGLSDGEETLVYTASSYEKHLSQLRSGKGKAKGAKSDLARSDGNNKAGVDSKEVKGNGGGLFGKRNTGDYAGKILVVPIGMDDLMITARFEFMKRVLKKARLDGAEALIFDMNTPGGRVWETGELMMRELQEVDFPTYTFVNTFAESGGCLVAIATDHIYMKPAALIGSALPVTASGDLEGNMKQKVGEMLRDLVRNVASLKGHDPDVAEAFVTIDTEVIKDGVTISEMGKVLHLSTEEATMIVNGKPLLAKGVANSIEEIIELEGLKGSLLQVEPLGLERFAHLIQKFSFLLLILGLAGAYMEMNAPGFGVPGVTSLLSFALFFFGNNLAGNLAGYELAALLVLGLILLAVEIFILPGTILPGLAGGLLIFMSLILAMVDRFDFQFHWKGVDQAPSLGELLNGPVMTLGVAVVGAVVMAVLLMRYLPTGRRLGGLILTQSLASGASLDELEDPQTGSDEKAGKHTANASDLLGREGVVSADLRPAGKGMFAGELLDIVADGEFIEEGTAVKIVLHEGSRLVVARSGG